MNNSLRRDITARLTGADYKGVIKGPYIQRIECPDCHKREAYAHAESPWMILCGRMDKCGAAIHVKDEMADLFDSWTDRYQPTGDAKPSPLAVAEGYLRDGRGFDLARIKGRYSQEYHHDHKLGVGSTTVRFTLPGGATWERILDQPWRFGKKKAVFVGDYKGEAWQLHHDKKIVASGECWIVEGIFDSIALAHTEIHAISAMSCVNFPANALERLKRAAADMGEERPTLVWALDSNFAGREWTEKHVAKARALGWTCTAAQPPFQRDWNDLHQRNELDSESIARYRHYGNLLLAATPTDKGVLMHEKREQRSFWFEYKRQLFWFELDTGALEKAIKAITGDEDADERQILDHERRDAIRQSAKVNRICTAFPTALYYQANELTDESWYYWRIDSPSGESVQNTFTSGHLSSASEFNKRVLGVSPGALWSGSSQQLMQLLQDQFYDIKTVKTVDFIGYSKDHKAWVLGDVAVCNKRVYTLTSEDYFNLGRLRLKTLSQSVPLAINTQMRDFKRDWVDNIIGAWGANGIVALAFWLGSLFAEQIREEFKSYPFFEMVGEPGTGKTTLLEFLWKLCGRTDYEGFDPAKASMAARSRNFAQVSNLPVVLIESDRDADANGKAKQFDWDELKTAFNGRSIRARGVKNGGNETYEPPFRGAVVISQNANVQASPAIQSRICHIEMRAAAQNRETKAHSEAIERQQVEDVSGFILEATRRGDEVLQILRERVTGYENWLLSDESIRAFRIGRNHGQLLALVDCLGPEGLGLITEKTRADTARRVADMARERQVALNADHPVIEEFWEAFDYLEDLYDTPMLNHYGKFGEDGLIAVNLKHFEAVTFEHRIAAPAAKELKRHLRASRSRKFVDSNRTVNSRIFNKSTRCWVFRDERLANL